MTGNPRGAQAPAPALEPPPLSPRAVPPKSKTAPGPRLWPWAIAVLLLVAAVGWWQFRPAARGSARPGALPFRTAKVYTGTLQQTLRVTGVTSANRYVILLSPQMQGSRRGTTRGHGDFELTLQKLAEGGIYVKKDDVVAEFDQQHMMNRLDDYRAVALQHVSYLKRLRALLDVTRTNHDQLVLVAKARMEKAALDLKKTPVVSANQAERLRLNLEEYTSRYHQLVDETKYVLISESAAIKRMELDLRTTQMELGRAERNADKMRVRSPIDGLTVRMTTHRNHDNVQISEGDTLGSGQPFMRIVDTRSMMVTADVNQVDAQKVRLGMTAMVRFDAYPDLELPATVVAVGAFAQGSGWRPAYVRSVIVRLQIEKPDPRVIPDLSVGADLQLASAPPSPVVPRECIFTAPGGSQPFVFVRNGQDWEKRPVEPLLENHIATALRSGVREGEVVAAEWPASEAPQQAGGL